MASEGGGAAAAGHAVAVANATAHAGAVANATGLHVVHAHNRTAQFEQQSPEEIRRAMLVFYLILLSMFGFQSALVFWHKRHKRSYDLVQLLGLFLVPAAICLHAGFWRFLAVWLLYSGVTAHFLAACSLRGRLDKSLPRRVYRWFFAVFKASIAVGLAGYALLVVDFMGVGALLQPVLGPQIGLTCLWYGLYFGILARDSAEIASDRIASMLGAGRKMAVSVRDCGICGGELPDGPVLGGGGASGGGGGGSEAPLVVQLSCKHLFHDDCIRGWTIVGKKDTCPTCWEKVDLRSLYGDRPWETRNLSWVQMLDTVRYLIVWNPLILVALHFFLHWTHLDESLEHHPGTGGAVNATALAAANATASLAANATRALNALAHMASKGAGAPPLPSKEQGLFRQVVKHYETKQYKKGIKTADTILKKFPEHGETLAMKARGRAAGAGGGSGARASEGLLLNCLDRKEEAYELVKRGVKADLRSHVCWHVYGLVYRSDRNYDEAIKCYKNALRLDRENIQMRDLPGFLDTRQTLLELKSSNKQNWVAFALAHHLCGHHEVAVKVLESLQATLPDDEAATPGEAYEHSELLMYKARVLEEGGLHAEALAVLEDGEARGRIQDRLGAVEQRGRLLLALGRHADAEAAYRRLLHVNIENYKYHDGLRAALALAPVAPPGGGADAGAPAAAAADAAAAARLAAAYASLQAEFPRSLACRRLPLDFLSGDAFAAAADAYVRRPLSKGVPSLFSDLRPLYADPAKAAALAALFARLEAALAAGGEFPPPAEGGGDVRAGGPHHASPHSLVWCRLYLAQHHDLLGDTAAALRLADACIEHSPALVEAHSAKARILKHAGDPEGAARVADAARCIDLADRYVNCQAVKALFRAGHVEQAERTAALFTRDGEQANNLFDMQATWYELSGGRAYLAAGQLGPALKRLMRIDAHFADFKEDQFDFHGYCIRKQTLRSYCDMLAMEDRLYSHPIYLKAVAGAVTAYLQLADSRAAEAAGSADEAKALEGMSPEEQKRHRQRKRKEEQRRAKEEAEAAAKAAAEAAAAAAGKKGDKAGDGKKKDPDPQGAQLLATPDPLGEAAKLAARLVQHAGGALQTHLLAFGVYSRRGRVLLALRAARRAAELAGAADPQAHGLVVRAALAAEQQQQQQGQQQGQQQQRQEQQPAAANGSPEPSSGAVAEVAREAAVQLLGGASPADYHRAWAEQHAGSSLQHRAAAAELTALLHPERAAEAARQLVGGGAGGATHKQAVAVHELLLNRLRQPAAADTWKAVCAQAFRLSAYFEGPDRVEVPLPAQSGAAEGANGLAHEVQTLKV
eukprot:scaffold20.g7802.t1